VVIQLGQRYNRGRDFAIEARNVSRRNIYVQGATLNGRQLQNFWFPASELLQGGQLILEMGPAPNQAWGLGALPAGG
jgi:putative alpha-1,2-mannosidase